ncbi:MAG: conjugal transfer protein TrbE [Hyphomonas sp.]|nr:conjugal transfer protein TrbE [Hyphomonas sp.]
MFDLRFYSRRRAKLTDYLTWAALIAPGIVLNKDGSFQRCLRFRGPDLDAATPAELIGQSERLSNALRRLGPGWCLHVEARRRPSPGYPESNFNQGLAWLIEEERRMLFEAAGARFETDYFLSVTFLPPPERARWLEALLFEGGEKAASTDYSAVLARFITESDAFLSLIEPLLPEADWLGDEDLLGYLHDCVSDRALRRLRLPEEPFHLDGLLTDASLTGGLSPKLGGKHLRLLSVRSFVSSTEPGLLDALNRLPVSYRWVTRFLPLGPEAARREITNVRRKWFAKRKGIMSLIREALFREESGLLDNDAALQAADADAALVSLGQDGVTAGYATIVIVIAEETSEAADAALRLIRQTTDSLGFVTEAEGVNAVEAWLGTLPGQAYADVRRPLVLTRNLAHLIPASAIWAGPETSPHLGGPPLMLAASDGATPFRLSLHQGDIGHTLVLGPTGSGKSVLLAMLVAQWLRYPGAQAFVFDKGRSSRAMVLGLGGVFHDPGATETSAPSFQPLGNIDQPAERTWAQDWLSGEVEAGGGELTPERRRELWRALDLLSLRPARERTLSLLTALIQDEGLRAALEPLTHAGPLGSLLDADRTSFGAGAVTAFEMEALLASKRAAAAVLPVIFHMLEARFDGRPTLIVLDEAWLYLKDTDFAARIQDWLKSLRKKNVAVIFASQELADVAASPLAATLNEAAATRIFLANDRAREPQTKDFYRAAGLNERQIEHIAGATPKRDYYITSRAGSRMIDLELGPAALAFAGAASPEDQRLIDRLTASGGSARFARRFLEAKGLGPAADALGRFDAADILPFPTPSSQPTEGEAA